MNSGPNWRTPQELIEIGFACSRVVMLNEAHDGLKRCVRTREVGRQILPTAYQAGARVLAMEALYSYYAAEANHTGKLSTEEEPGYLGQPEMQVLIQTALDLGFKLLAYDVEAAPPAGLDRAEVINWREDIQARNLVAALNNLATEAKILVWCGNGHAFKTVPYLNGKPIPLMGYRFKELSGLDPFVIDQTVTVNFQESNLFKAELWAKYGSQLEPENDTMGLLKEDIALKVKLDSPFYGSDAFILSTRNKLE